MPPSELATGNIKLLSPEGHDIQRRLGSSGMNEEHWKW